MKNRIEIDLDKLSNIAHTGVRRAVLFMGLGLNAAHRKDFNDYELSKLPTLPGQTGIAIEFFPRDLPVERVVVFKEEFATWISGCGLRELLEHYALFLDQIHDSALFVLRAAGRFDGDSQKALKDFSARGIPRKLELLKDRFGISPADKDCIDSLYEARNCLTHDLGMVLPKRGDNGFFLVHWRSLVSYGEGEETKKIYRLTDLVGQTTNEAISIIGKVEKIERHFPVNNKMILSQQDLWEICFFFKQFAIPNAVEAFKQFLIREGVRIEVTTSVSTRSSCG